MELGRIDRKYLYIPVTAKLHDGTPVTPAGIDIALTPPRATPTSATTWTAATLDAPSGNWRVLAAGPDADPTGAVVIPTVGADLWIREVDNPEITTANAGRITIS